MVLQTIWFEIRWFSKPYGSANHLIRISHVMVFICGTEYIIWDTVLLLVIYVPLIVDAHPPSSPGIHLPDESGEAEAVGQRRWAQREVEAEAEMNATLLANSETAAHRQHPNAPSGMAPTGKM
jgi:hypothetical protein